MTDISKCAGRDCDVRENCYRYIAPESKYRQSYIAPPVTGAACGFYWPTRNYLVDGDDVREIPKELGPVNPDSKKPGGRIRVVGLHDPTED